MDYNLTLFKESVREILLMSTQGTSSHMNPDANLSKNIDSNLSQALGQNVSFGNGESGDSDFINEIIK
jgi:hypothetical protein